MARNERKIRCTQNSQAFYSANIFTAPATIKENEKLCFLGGGSCGSGILPRRRSMFKKKSKKMLFSLIAATFLIGSVLPVAEMAESNDGGSTTATSGGATGTGGSASGGSSTGGGKTSSTSGSSDVAPGAGENWAGIGEQVMQFIGGIPVANSLNAKYLFASMGEVHGEAVCIIKPKSPQVNEKYKVTCAFNADGGWAVPPVESVSGVAQAGKNTSKPLYAVLMRVCGPHGAICKGLISASVNFTAYEGAGALSNNDFGGDVSEVKLDTGNPENGGISLSGSTPLYGDTDQCFFNNCGNTDDSGSGSTGNDWSKWNGTGNDIEQAVENGFGENGRNSYGASNDDWATSNGGSSGSRNLDDYFGGNDSFSTGDDGDGAMTADDSFSSDGSFASGGDFGVASDQDGDGVSDTWDTDGDGSIDAWDTNGDGKPDAWDANGDGIADAWDTNSDGEADAWDTDNDGAADAWDTNGDGVADAWDTNGDGQPDAWDTNGDGKPDAWDTDGDGVPDAWDTDGDGQPDAWDTDGDGIADKFANDSSSSLGSEGEDGSIGNIFDKIFGQGKNGDNSLLGNVSGIFGGLANSLFGDSAKTASDSEMYNYTHKLLSELGYSADDILNGKNYDTGSAYTDPKKAWDMNRITTLLSKHRIALDKNADTSLPAKDNIKKAKVSGVPGSGAISSATAAASAEKAKADAATAEGEAKKEELMSQVTNSSDNGPKTPEEAAAWEKQIIDSMPEDQKAEVMKALADGKE